MGCCEGTAFQSIIEKALAALQQAADALNAARSQEGVMAALLAVENASSACANSHQELVTHMLNWSECGNLLV